MHIFFIFRNNRLEVFTFDDRGNLNGMLNW